MRTIMNTDSMATLCTIKPVSNHSNFVYSVGHLYTYFPILITRCVTLLLSTGVTFILSTKLIKCAKRAIKNLVALSFLIVMHLRSFIQYIFPATICMDFHYCWKVCVLTTFHWKRREKLRWHLRDYQTFRESSRETQPSATRFTIPYKSYWWIY